jgi:dTDP-4-dehydrorhamnose 3,5-epimerase
MIFTELALQGAWLIAPEPFTDERGSFARTFCAEEFARHSLDTIYPQHSLSTSKKRGTLRGLHFQLPPHDEVKVVRCVAGAIYDVVVDIRMGSPTYRKWVGVELSADNGHQIYVPRGFAHGHMTLTDNASVLYLISAPYAPGAAAGVRYDDPAIGVKWPMMPIVVSERDKSWPRLT